MLNSARAHDDAQSIRPPQVDSSSWVGQLESIEDPYLADPDKKVETGFRGSDVHTVRDHPSEK